MKKIVLVLLSGILLTGIATAQQRIEERNFSIESDAKVKLDLKFGETIVVKAWGRDEVGFQATISVNNGKLNDALELVYDAGRTAVTISADYDHEKLKQGRSADCPSRSYSKYSWDSGEGNYVVCSTITYEVYVPATADLEVESISGDIELVDLRGPIRAKSISGFVDLSWPSGNPATIDMKTISGEAFTDIDELEFSNKKAQIPLVGYKINATIAGGGPRVSLESISGNIYLRQGQS